MLKMRKLTIALLFVFLSSTFAYEVFVKGRFADGRIVGGEDVNITDYPYQFSLLYFHRHRCGGSIISPRWGLSAAHCVQVSGPFVNLFSVRVGSTLVNTGGNIVGVIRIISHPNYNRYNLIENDIALLETASDLTAFPNTAAVPLPPFGITVPAGSTAVVTGWGALAEGGPAPSVLQMVRVPIISHSSCRDAYGHNRITDDMLCAGSPYGGRDACQGDSGGPLVVNGVQMGVVSWGNGCARPDFPGVYAHVPYLRQWIYDNTGV